MPQAVTARKTSNTITLKTPVFILIIVAIVIALIIGFLGGAATMYRGASSQIASAQGDAANWKRAYEDLSQSQDSPDSKSDSFEDTSTGKSSDSHGGSSSDSGNITKTKGETETNGTLDLTFNSMEEIASVPQEWNGTQPDLTPTDGTRFISVKVHIVNNGQQPVDLTCGYVVDIRAVNSSNQQYTPIDNLFKIPGNPECNADLQPGMGADMQYVFNVPQNAKMVGFGWRDVTDISTNNDYSTFRF